MEEGDMIIAMVFLFLVASVACAALVDSFNLKAMHFSVVNIAVGIVFGGLVRLAFSDPDWHDVTFDHKIFFKMILPVIVFGAGYTFDIKTFTSNFRAIVLLAVLGTVVNWLALGLTTVALNEAGLGRPLDRIECLLLTACLASTDTVAVIALLDPAAAPTLYAVLAGEGIVNDGVSVALYGAVKNVADDDGVSNNTGVDGDLMGRVTEEFMIVLLGSTAVGVAVGLFSALLTKWKRATPPPEIEVSLVFLTGFFAYFLAEGLEWSGILSLFVCGMVMAQYTVWSMSKVARFTTYHTLTGLSYAGMTLIFSALGFFIWAYFDEDRFWGDVTGRRQDFELAFALLGLIVVYRIAYVLLFVAIANCGKPKSMRLLWRDQIVTVYGGLVRGVIAFALSQDINTTNRDGIITVVYIIVLVTTVVLGCLTKPVLNAFVKDPPAGYDAAMELPGESMPLTSSVAAGQSSQPDSTPSPQQLGMRARAQELWDEVNGRYLRPVFGGRGQRPESTALADPFET
eukprot:TRINITY_DN525_c10_g1_i1.p1 TRINITY_DN525_c10_g1~~TRINITY_DN525_c10_g1_i1.p1  ORF type:complete len:542 (+),score=161.53 TRINITY_DN525_c10_g1_i1:89-1627(+)